MSDEVGRWLTTGSTVAKIGSGKEAVAALHLAPSGNLAEKLSKLTITEGSEIFVGRIRNGAAWATQIWIRDKKRLRLLGQIDEYEFEP